MRRRVPCRSRDSTRRMPNVCATAIAKRVMRSTLRRVCGSNRLMPNVADNLPGHDVTCMVPRVFRPKSKHRCPRLERSVVILVFMIGRRRRRAGCRGARSSARRLANTRVAHSRPDRNLTCCFGLSRDGTVPRIRRRPLFAILDGRHGRRRHTHCRNCRYRYHCRAHDMSPCSLISAPPGRRLYLFSIRDRQALSKQKKGVHSLSAYLNGSEFLMGRNMGGRVSVTTELMLLVHTIDREHRKVSVSVNRQRRKAGMQWKISDQCSRVKS